MSWSTSLRQSHIAPSAGPAGIHGAGSQSGRPHARHLRQPSGPGASAMDVPVRRAAIGREDGIEQDHAPGPTTSVSQELAERSSPVTPAGRSQRSEVPAPMKRRAGSRIDNTAPAEQIHLYGQGRPEQPFRINLSRPGSVRMHGSVQVNPEQRAEAREDLRQTRRCRNHRIASGIAPGTARCQIICTSELSKRSPALRRPGDKPSFQ